jgi:hypothetical protein
MQPTRITDQIKVKAIELLRHHPEGLRYTELQKQILASNADFKPNTVAGSIWNLDATFPNEVYKPSRGLFRLLSFKPTETDESKESTLSDSPTVKLRELDFYAPFADWLQNELEEVTLAIALGGNTFKDKWGTPDVIGKNEPRRSDIVKGATEIVSAEIKIDTTQLITAFGQVCAYKLFSHKAYLVIPRQAQNEEISRLDSLCQIFGIGLVTFDVNSTEAPDFRIFTRAARHEPDLFYTNKYMTLIEKELFS